MSAYKKLKPTYVFAAAGEDWEVSQHNGSPVELWVEEQRRRHHEDCRQQGFATLRDGAWHVSMAECGDGEEKAIAEYLNAYPLPAELTEASAA